MRTKWHWPASLRFHPVVWLFAAVVVVVSWVELPTGGGDWRWYFGPAARDALVDPSIRRVPNPPAISVLLWPLGLLSDRMATTVTNGLSVIVVASVTRRFGGPDWLAVPVLVSPPGYWLFRAGQIDWLPLLGLLISNGFDVVLLMLKPQVAIGVVVPRLRRAGVLWLRYLMPAAVIGFASLILWPGWPLNAARVAPSVDAWWNVAVWPWGLPVGGFLLWRAWKSGEEWLGVAASPFLFPFLSVQSYLGLLIVLAARWPRPALVVWAVANGTLILLRRWTVITVY